MAFAAMAAMPLQLRAEEPLAVAVVTAERTETTRHYALTGEIVARETLSASFPTGGRIVSISVQDGDKVEAGAELGRIDPVQQEQALRGAKAQLAAAKAEYLAAKEDRDRQESLLERGATTRAAQTIAADRFAAAVAGQAQAEAELEQAQDALDDTVLSAPGKATVIRRLAEPGQVVGAAQPILELAQGDGFEAIFNVPEAVLTRTRASAPPVITLSPLEHPEISVKGHVREISPLVDAATGTVEVRVTLEAAIPGLGYGDAVRGATDDSDGEAIVLPWSAISATAGGQAVWIVDPATQAVALRQIEVRRYTSDAILVTEGVEPGETVVSLGTQLLYPGRIVRVVEAAQW